ncbi:PDZ domain-containing protein [Propionibacterium cyclohexanicum]|uniref:PDZ domain-containing protein n=1 Tax=Propionibacterium cyclohexanicum TaxID=64702 RepID=A0A1H9QY19_9ACTN|nr:PDZ domain-containing protein [Propionibacterium cyclohexanicum]SER65356.1 PDZ domain-containing protein [Propionibacterium cyclohexanicum]
MTRRAATVLASGICFVILLGIMFVVPVPFVSWSPGVAQNALGSFDNRPVVEVDGKAGPPTSGQLLMIPTAITRPGSQLTFPEALGDYLAAHRDVQPRDWVYPVGQSAAELDAARIAGIKTAQQSATVAALRVAGVEVRQNPVVSSVSTGGPSYRLLTVGDIVETVNGTSVQTSAEVSEIVSGLTVGDPVKFGIVRQGASMDVTVTTQASASSRDVPRIGITMDEGYRYAPHPEFAMDERNQNSSSGLMLALALYERVSNQDITGGRIIAGTGTIEPTGAVGVTRGIDEKVYAAERLGASVFLVPASNCSEAHRLSTRMTLVKVNKLDDAVNSLHALNTIPNAVVPTC